MINTHNGVKEKGIEPVNINDYPAIKKHLDKYYERLEKRHDQGVTPYNLRNCAYMEDFDRQKIIYPNMTKFLPFYIDEGKYLTNQKCFILSGSNLFFLIGFLNSSLFKYCFKDNFPTLQGGTRELSKIFFERLPIINEVSTEMEIRIKGIIRKIQSENKKNKNTIDLEKELDLIYFNLYRLNVKEKEAVGFIEIQ